MSLFCARCGANNHRASQCPWPLRLALVQDTRVGVYDVRPKPCHPKQVAVYHAGPGQVVDRESVEACRVYREPPCTPSPGSGPGSSPA